MFDEGDNIPDVGVNGFPHLLYILRSLASGNVGSELLLVLLRVLSLEVLHVVGDMSSEDVLAEHSWVELLLLLVVTRETLVLVGDIETTVNGTLHDTKDTGTSGGEVETNVKEDVERTLVSVLFNEEVSTIRLGLTNILLIKTQLGEDTTGSKETSGVGSGIVLLASLLVDSSSVLGQLVRVGGSKDDVAVEGGVRNLAGNIFVRLSRVKDKQVVLVSSAVIN